ncbi:glycosyltransferase family 2 protein [Butyrivibrio sp. AC2005]|uniref:glycosyltransferase family 2 protein n=1 Tax=Butyrivibrio sp. AC2005 TaxID=1280672 RepID=UPI0003FB112E|nr:glycosyltransferase family 2 protein [Butyrivibrio sp. AC2005]
MKKTVTVLMPCLNEAITLPVCIRKAKDALEKMGGCVDGEVLVADNGSNDGSIEIAESMGARVIHVEQRGYGSALRAGIDAAKSEYIIMGDADDSYDFSAIKVFVDKLDEGFDLVMGDRFAGGIQPGAMSFSHKYIGNPVLSGIGRLFFKTKIRDFHCGMRGFRKESIQKLDLCTTGMEFASEMVVKAVLFGLKISEVPIKLYPDGRNRPPHLRSLPDGWRHLKFLLIYSPKWLFFYPGLLMTIIGFVGMLILSCFTIHIGKVQFEITTMFYFAILLLTGCQAVQFSLFTNIYGKKIGQLPATSKLFDNLESFISRFGLGMALLLVLAGLTGIIATLVTWSGVGFGELPDMSVHRLAILFGTLFILGIQFFFSGFFINVLYMGDEKIWG